MGNLRKRIPPPTTFTGMPIPSRMKHPGHELRRLPRLRNEDKGEAIARAMHEPWWPRVVHRIPVPSCGVWCWQVRP